MREILFRGKRVDSSDWVYGVPTKDGHGETVMMEENTFKCDEYNCRSANFLYVDENTIGQYTGLTDKNGTKIFEGDIVSTDLERPYNIVVFRDGCFMFNCNDGNQDYYDIMLPILRSEHTHYEYGEVIGNIYDNTELLRGDTE